MKYPEKKRIYDIYKCTKDGKEVYVIRAVGDRFEYICKTLKEAQETREKLHHLRVLDSEDVNKYQFVKYYGCGICADVITNKFKSGNPLIDASSKARFCPHHECPYAEQIEKYGGYEGYEEYMDGLNYSFIDFSQAINFYK